MNEGSSGSASNSGTTPGNAAPKPQHNLTEAEYLQQRAEEAQQAITRTLKLIGANFGRGVNPAAWTEEHPWIMLGSAAVTGFVVTSLIPSKADRDEKRVLRRLAAIERAVAPRPVVSGGDAESDPSRHGIGRGILNAVLKSIQPALTSAVMGAVTAKAAQNDDGDNGAADAAADPAYASVATPAAGE